MPGSNEPYTAPELIELAESYGRVGTVPYVVARLLATCAGMAQMISKYYPLAAQCDPWCHALANSQTPTRSGALEQTK